MWVKDKKLILQELQQIDSSVILTTKDNWFCTCLSYILYIISFTKFKRELFLCRFATTIGPLIFFPKHWSTNKVLECGIHETRHTRQARWFGLFIHPWVGLPFMGLFYLFLFFPIKLAYFRYLLERDAEMFRLKYLLERKRISKEYAKQRSDRFVKTISSAAYIWCWPRSWVKKGFDKKLEKIFEELEINKKKNND